MIPRLALFVALHLAKRHSNSLYLPNHVNQIAHYVRDECHRFNNACDAITASENPEALPPVEPFEPSVLAIGPRGPEDLRQLPLRSFASFAEADIYLITALGLDGQPIYRIWPSDGFPSDRPRSVMYSCRWATVARPCSFRLELYLSDTTAEPRPL